MFTLNVLSATRTIEKTMPFMLYRLLLCLGLGLTILLATLISAGTIIAFASFAKNPSALAGVGAGLGFIASVYGAYRLRPVWFKTLSLSHLALLADQIRQKDIPEGTAQIGYAGLRVTASLPSGSELRLLDERIKACLEDIMRIHPPLVLTHPVAQKGVNLLAGGLFASLHHTVLAWHFYSDGSNAWPSARTALTCLAEHHKKILLNRLFMSVFEGLGFIAAFWLMLYPTAWVADSLPVAVGLWQYVFAAVFAWGLKMAFLEPISEATLMEGILPNILAVQEQATLLTAESEAFRRMLEPDHTE
ncbi:MAG: hypothetical protein ACR2HF_06525 [Methylococcaceae bacterium]